MIERIRKLDMGKGPGPALSALLVFAFEQLLEFELASHVEVGDPWPLLRVVVVLNLINWAIIHVSLNPCLNRTGFYYVYQIVFSNFRTFLSPLEEIYTLHQSFPCPLFSKSLVTICYFPCWWVCAFGYKCNLTICAVLCQTSFMQHNAFRLHPCYRVLLYFIAF